MSITQLSFIMDEHKKFSRNKQEKINSIYNTFYKLLNEIGYYKITTNLIAEVSEVSIGTIYRYFPNGKSSIIKGSLKHTSNKIFDISDFNNMNNSNLPETVESMIRKHLRVHRENVQYHKAVNLAILSNKDLFLDYGDNLNTLFETIVDEIQKNNNLFKNIPRNSLISTFLLIFNTLEAFIHRHLFIVQIFPNDEDLVLFLKNLLLMLLNTKQT
jgi:AcrR family transcriptional regulator